MTSRKPPSTEKGMATRTAILNAAESVFTEHGYADASISRITERAGVGQGTFYLYFGSKLEVFEETAVDLNRRVRQAMSEASAAAPTHLEGERAGFRAFFAFTTEHPGLYRVVREAEIVSPRVLTLHYTRIVEGYIANLTRARSRGEVRDLDPTVAAWVLMGIGEMVGMRWVLWNQDGGHADRGTTNAVPDDVFDQVMDFIERALAPSPPTYTPTPAERETPG